MAGGIPIRDALPAWFEDYVGLENGAKSLFTYQNQLVHGLMQTEDYVSCDSSGSAAVSHRGRSRAPACRQGHPPGAADRCQPAVVWAVLDEAVLRRQVGGKAAMRAQLRRLLEISAFPNVTLQVTAVRRRARMRRWVPRSNFCSSLSPGDTAIVYIEDQTTSQYLETTADVERYTLVFDHLRASALSPERSAEFIDQVAAGMT